MSILILVRLQQNRFAGFVACPAEKPLVGQFIDMKIAGNISANLEACKGDMSNRGALPDNVQNDNWINRDWLWRRMEDKAN